MLILGHEVQYPLKEWLQQMLHDIFNNIFVVAVDILNT